ncbi:MAG: hypothetical protein U0Q18_20635 [Bryobacteraceae bacterium]
MQTLTRSTMVLAAAAMAFLIWTFANRQFSVPAATNRPAPVYKDVLGIDNLTSVTILNFYASPGIITEGDNTTLCYGVAKAKTVRLDPPVQALSPSLNRCIQVAPEQDTQYTLTASGEDGRTVSESFTIQVKDDPLRLPQVLYFIAQKKENSKPPVYSLCFGVENGGQVSVDPPVIPTMQGAPRGCFYVTPNRTTTYTLLVAGHRGRTAQKKVTIPAP